MFRLLLLLIAAPPDADQSLAPWFHSLQDPSTGGMCCGIADCRNYPVRADGEHYYVLFEGTWIIVPDEAILDRFDNPTGDYIACVQKFTWQNGSLLPPSVRCLVKPPRI